MSYYTYFYPKRGYNNPQNKTVEQIKNQRSAYERTAERYKALLVATMVDAYYANTTDLNTFYDRIFTYVSFYRSYKDDINKADWALTVESLYKEVDDGKEKEPVYWINHFNYDSEYDLDEVLENYENSTSRITSELLVISRIKTDSDTNVEEYLQSTYINKINDIIDEIDYNVEEKNSCEFFKKYWDTKKTEDDLAKDENFKKVENNKEEKKKVE